MVRDGCEHPATPTTRAGTPATVVLGGTGFNTKAPAATREHAPISILPSTLAPIAAHNDGYVLSLHTTSFECF